MWDMQASDSAGKGVNFDSGEIISQADPIKLPLVKSLEESTPAINRC
jgi:hypothetical protein